MIWVPFAHDLLASSPNPSLFFSVSQSPKGVVENVIPYLVLFQFF
jgi:hypothetical protein